MSGLLSPAAVAGAMLFACLFAPPLAMARNFAVEISSLAPAFAQAGRLASEGKKSLLVLDLDNVVICEDSYLGNRAWFSSLYSGYLSSLQKADPAILKAEEDKLSLFMIKLQKTASPRLTEADIPAKLRGLGRAGVEIMALTGRHRDASGATLAALKRLGVDFSINAPKGLDKAAGVEETAFCSAGVCFGRLQDKGKLLLELLAKTGQHYDAVLFVDDSRWNVESVARVLEGAAIKATVYRYGGRDALLRSYEAPGFQAAARVQLKELALHGRLLSNKKAQALSETAPVSFEEQLRLIFGPQAVPTKAD